MKHVCPKCHKKKKVGIYSQHVRGCIASAKDITYLSATKSGSFNKIKATGK